MMQYKGRWCAERTIQGEPRKRIRKFFKTKKEAQKWLNENAKLSIDNASANANL